MFGSFRYLASEQTICPKFLIFALTLLTMRISQNVDASLFLHLAQVGSRVVAYWLLIVISHSNAIYKLQCMVGVKPYVNL